MKIPAFFRWLLPAAASGVLLGLAFPPVNAWWLVWVGLAPLLWAIRRERRVLPLFTMGLIAGTVMFLIVLYPLASAHLWSGWQAVESSEIAGMKSRQAIVLHGLWVGVSLWVGLTWSLFSLGLSWLSRGNLLRMAVFAPPLFILFPEWLRSLMIWDFTWGFLGNAAIEVPGIVQLGALGGVWLLSWLVVLVNVALLALASPGTWPGTWRRPLTRQTALPATVAAIAVLALSWGLWRGASLPSKLESNEGLAVAALQYHQDRYRRSDYTYVGLEKAYLQLMRQVAEGEMGEVDLLVLPESITFAPLSLDGSTKAEIPEKVQRDAREWWGTIAWVIQSSDKEFGVIFGLDTIEDQTLHNSLVYWNRSGLQGRYHKQWLVPFGEYQPPVFERLGIRGKVQYDPGQSSHIVALNGTRIGGFICQEVQIPAVLRRSVKDGAEILVSGGNDGVFADPAVAEVHARMGRLRAVETGRYVIRAMKTGVSAIIAPTGEELARSPGKEPFVAVERVQPRTEITPYVRFGDWPLGLAGLLILAGVVSSLGGRRPLGVSPSPSARVQPPP
jgi:apolipoprotein N-acyltransferase